MGFAMAIDGPAGAGKSTIAKLTGKKLGLTYIDTGAMYRATAYYFVKNDVNPDNEAEVNKACESINISIEYNAEGQQVILNDNNITSHLREEAIGKMASRVAKLSRVRSKLVALQREMAANGKVIMDGRDIGTCVLPNAEAKVYLTASSKVRAKRRYDELVAKGQQLEYKDVLDDLIKRDYQDSHREIAPLKPAEDSVTLDTGDMNFEQSLDALVSLINKMLSDRS